MDFKSKLTPKVDLAGAAAAMKSLQKLATNLQTIGQELGSIVSSLGTIGSIIADISGGNKNREQIKTLSEEIQKINSSKKTVMENVDEIKAILEELSKVAGDDKKPGKVRRVVDATFDLIELVAKIMEKLVDVVEKVEMLTKGGNVGNTAEVCKGIVDNVKEIGEMVKLVKENVQEIIGIVKGDEGKSKAKSGGEGNAKKDQGKKADENKVAGKVGGDGDDDEEPGGCWASFKRCCCCCCN